VASGSLRGEQARKLLQPTAIWLVLLTCAADALYQLCQYQVIPCP